MIRYLDNQEKVLTKNLWREAFPEDSEEFLTYYDQEKMTTNDNQISPVPSLESAIMSILQTRQRGATGL